MDSIVGWIDRAALDGRDVLVASDFDGTLADIAERPEEVELVPRARAALSSLARARGVHVAILSGRTLEDLAPRVAPLGPMWLGADHGSVVVDPRLQATVFDAALPTSQLRALHERAIELARVFRGARVEQKARSVALHFREVSPHKHDAIIEMFRLACRAQRASVLVGRCVVEGRFATGDKGAALAFIQSQLPPGTATIYTGDDASDEPALSLAHRDPLGLALHVQSRERLAPSVKVNGWLAGPGEWIEILEALAALRNPSHAA